MIARQATPLESGAPLGNSDALRRALGHFPTGVTIITAEAGGTRVGVTANSFSSVSLDPPLILWSVKRSSSSWPVFAAADAFAVNVLAADQTELAAQFARSGTDKYKGVVHRSGRTGAPLLADVAAQFECLRRFEYEGGDHLIVVGEVQYFARFERRPLVFTQGRYSTAIDNPEPGQATVDVPSRARPTMLTMLRRAFLQRASEFVEEAHAAGFTRNESRLTYHLEMSPGLTLDDLARVALLDVEAAEDSVASLAARGWLTQFADGTLGLTAIGKAQNRTLLAATLDAEAGKLKDFSAAEVDAARRVIASFGGHLDNIPATLKE